MTPFFAPFFPHFQVRPIIHLSPLPPPLGPDILHSRKICPAQRDKKKKRKERKGSLLPLQQSSRFLTDIPSKKNYFPTCRHFPESFGRLQEVGDVYSRKKNAKKRRRKGSCVLLKKKSSFEKSVGSSDYRIKCNSSIIKLVSTSEKKKTARGRGKKRRKFGKRQRKLK